MAASLDSFLATTLDVNSPAGVVLPDNGLTIIQPDNPTPADAQACEPLPAGSLSGRLAPIFTGSTGAGSGNVPYQIGDEAGGISGSTGTYTAG